MGADGSGELSQVRLDKWTWAARCFKTRSKARQACVGGLVQLNGVRARPAQKVKVGDLVQVSYEHGPRILQVVALAGRRGPAAAARLLYEDLTPPEPPREPPPMDRERGLGRPTKRDRRALGRLRWEDL